jgi:hypothetical protein
MMPKKKKIPEGAVTTKKALAAKRAEESAPSIDEVMDKPKLTELEMVKLDGLRTRAELQISVMDRIRLQMELLSIRYKEEQAVLKGKLKSSDNSREEAMLVYNSLMVEIETRLGVKMEECVVADDGTLTHQDEIG